MAESNANQRRYTSDYVRIFSNFLLPTLPDSSAPGIAATNRVRTVLFECLFNHLADERVESLFTILGFEHDFDCYAIAGYLPGPPHVRPREIEKIVADFGGVCLTAKRPIGNSTAVVALIRPVGAATPEIICNTSTRRSPPIGQSPWVRSVPVPMARCVRFRPRFTVFRPRRLWPPPSAIAAPVTAPTTPCPNVR